MISPCLCSEWQFLFLGLWEIFSQHLHWGMGMVYCIDTGIQVTQSGFPSCIAPSKHPEERSHLHVQPGQSHFLREGVLRLWPWHFHIASVGRRKAWFLSAQVFEDAVHGQSNYWFYASKWTSGIFRTGSFISIHSVAKAKDLDTTETYLNYPKLSETNLNSNPQWISRATLFFVRHCKHFGRTRLPFGRLRTSQVGPPGDSLWQLSSG